MSFQQALSGLNASSASLDAISNNVANSGTVGFKQGQAHFADIFAASLSGNGGAGQIGIGTSMSAVAQAFNEGNITVTNNSLDLAINGQGFFKLGNGNYTRNGQFHVDGSGNIVNDQSQRLQGFSINPVTGLTNSTLGDLTISTAQINGGNAKATATSSIAVNVNSAQAQPSAMTPAIVQGIAAAPLTLPAGYQITLTAGSIPPGSTLAPVTISASAAGPLTFGPYASVSAMQSALQTAVTTAFANNALSVPAPVVSLNAAGTGLKISSGSLGSQTTITVAETATVPTNTLFPAVPVMTAGTDNFSTANANSYSSSTSETVYDSLGAQHSLTTYFAKSATPGLWTAYFGLDNTQVAPLGGASIKFDANGNIDPTSAKIALPSIPLGASLIPTAGPSAALPLTISLDLTGTTQFGTAFAINQITQDGYPPGSLSGMSVDPKGIIQAHYSNGQQINVAQVALASFQNPNGLQSVGGNQWQATVAAGSVNTNTPGASNLGLLESGAVEESNVDLTKELVNMITAQRAYQANAQSIKTEDQIMQTLVSLR